MRRLVAAICVLCGALLAGSIATSLASASETVNYTYDARGRLIKAQHSGSVNGNVVANYSYDATDNRNVVSVSGAPQ